MEKVSLKFQNRICEVYIGNKIIKDNLSLLPKSDYFILIDKNVYDNYYDEYFKDKFDPKYVYIFDSFEENKNINRVIDIITHMSDLSCLRNFTLVSIGGGVLGDICGFIASIYMRGIKSIYIPTTLLSMVDSSIGGKNAVNINGIKNLIGTINQPEKVIIDISFINTLGGREILSGLAEVIKYGIICDSSFLKKCKDSLKGVFNKDYNVIFDLIYKSVYFKKDIIEKDEYDMSIRKILNHGHTIGHAIESLTNYKLYTHGEGVIIGMYYESLISFKLNLIDEDYFNYIGSILKSFGISFDEKLLNRDKFYEALCMDKKNIKDRVSFILPIGESKVLEHMLSLDEIRNLNIYNYCF